MYFEETKHRIANLFREERAQNIAQAYAALRAKRAQSCRWLGRYGEARILTRHYGETEFDGLVKRREDDLGSGGF